MLDPLDVAFELLDIVSQLEIFGATPVFSKGKQRLYLIATDRIVTGL